MRKLLVGLVVVGLTGCVSIPSDYKNVRVSTNVSLLTANSLTSKYVERPTFSTNVTWEGANYISYTAKTFGSTYHEGVGYIENGMGFAVTKTQAHEFIFAIDKYLRWENKAIQNEDILKKEISVTGFDKFAGQEQFTKFSFYSGNKHSHYLVVDQCASSMGMDICVKEAYIDKKNALILKTEITQFVNGESKIDLVGEYN